MRNPRVIDMTVDYDDDEEEDDSPRCPDCGCDLETEHHTIDCSYDDDDPEDDDPGDGL
jgi:hypothetical protein